MAGDSSTTKAVSTPCMFAIPLSVWTVIMAGYFVRRLPVDTRHLIGYALLALLALALLAFVLKLRRDARQDRRRRRRW